MMKRSNDEKAFLEKASRIIAKINDTSKGQLIQNNPDRIPEKEMITYLEAKQKYNVSPRNRSESDLILRLDGDVYVNGNLTTQWLRKQVEGKKWDGDFYGGIIIVGDLVVDGDVLDDDNLELHAMQKLTCDYLFSKNGVISIEGDLRVKYGIYGEYNDGELDVNGAVFSPYIIASDHQMPRNSVEEFIYIEGGDDSEIEYIGIGRNKGASVGWGWNYFEDPAKLLSPKVFDQAFFSTKLFFNLVRKGENPFLKVTSE